MNFEAGLPQFTSVSDEKKNHCVLTATLRNFSKNGESEFTEYSAEDEEFALHFRPVFYANGDSKENEGYVSVIFYGGAMTPFIIYISHIEFSCTVAVIDASENKRFMQTLAFVHDPNSVNELENGDLKFGLSKYLKRETLLMNPAELLPNDCLTIYLEIDYIIRVCTVDFSQCIIQDTFIRDGDRYYFSLDSKFGKELCKVCDYFRSASVIPMIENETRRVYIPPEELKAFHHIELIFTEAEEIKIESFEDICQLYTIADKYNIEAVIETCRELVKSFLCKISDPKVLEHTVESIPMVLELAETYSDESLKGIVGFYLESKNNFQENEYALEEELKNKLNMKWNCEYEKIEKSTYFKLRRIECVDTKMEFYK